ncbi:MAG TPA: hypothetical protein VIX86_26395 [Streptosporangiaceae bacterium]
MTAIPVGGATMTTGADTQAAVTPPSSDQPGPPRLQALGGLERLFQRRYTTATRAARRAGWWAPILVIAAAAGSAFAATALTLATSGTLSGTLRNTIIIVGFASTAIGAAGAALRPTERAQAAKTEAANANALLSWLDVLRFEQAQIADDSEFYRRIQALRAWYVRQLGAEPFAYDGSAPWTPPGDATATGGAAPPSDATATGGATPPSDATTPGDVPAS